MRRHENKHGFNPRTWASSLGFDHVYKILSFNSSSVSIVGQFGL